MLLGEINALVICLCLTYNLPMTTLEQLRADIDAIDDDLIALLKKRIEVVGRVGALKREQGASGLFIRSGREGEMHQRIVEAFKDTPYSTRAMIGIWRLLISASTHHESPMSLGVLGATDNAELLALAQGYFGDFMERRSYSSASSLLADLFDKRISIGIMPYPHNDANWWQHLLQYRSENCVIFAQLPVHAVRPQEPCALAIGAVVPEASGDDVSYVAVQAEETVSTSRLHSFFQLSGLKAEFINAALRPSARDVLVRIDGFYADDAPELLKLRELLERGECIWLGAHPKPIELAAV